MQLARAPYKVIPIVAPISADPATSGKIRNLPVGGGVEHSQLEAIRNEIGDIIDYDVRAPARRRGWVRLQDLYEAEGRAEDWDLYRRHMEAASAGRTRVPFPRDRLPAEVLRRQQAAVPDEFAELLAHKPIAIHIEPEPKAGADAKPERKGRGEGRS